MTIQARFTPASDEVGFGSKLTEVKVRFYNCGLCDSFPLVLETVIFVRYTKRMSFVLFRLISMVNVSMVNDRQSRRKAARRCDAITAGVRA